MPQFRNPQFTADGTVKAEINHPKYGWIWTTFAVGSADEADALAGTVAPYTPPAVTARMVDEERDRRIQVGTTFAVAGYGDIRVAGDSTTTRNLQGLVTAAQIRVGAGDVTTLTPYRDEDNIIHQLTPLQMIDLWSQAAAFVSALFQSAWTLKDDPAGIPSNFTDGVYWP